MSTAALRARLKRLEARRSGTGWEVVELLLDSHGLQPPLAPELRAAALAAARKRWPRGVSLEGMLAASWEAAEGGT